MPSEYTNTELNTGSLSMLLHKKKKKDMPIFGENMEKQMIQKNVIEKDMAVEENTGCLFRLSVAPSDWVT